MVNQIAALKAQERRKLTDEKALMAHLTGIQKIIRSGAEQENELATFLDGTAKEAQCYFSFPQGSSFANTVISYDASEDIVKLVESDQINVKAAKPLQINGDEVVQLIQE